MDLDGFRQVFKHEVMTRVGLLSHQLRQMARDIDLRADDLFVEYRSTENPVVHELRARLLQRIDHLYELQSAADLAVRPLYRTIYAYAQYVYLYRCGSAVGLTAMRQLFDRELLLVQLMAVDAHD